MKKAYFKYKTGAASFYVVAFSTLILMVVAASFATAIVAELTRSSNDDLAQSAYDSAMAGVEDAKLAFANYRACLEKISSSDKLDNDPENISCKDIVYWVSHPDGESNDYNAYDGCNMVAHVLGRIEELDENMENIGLSIGVKVNEGNPDSDLDQAYTCTKIMTKTSDYRATLTPLNPYKIVKVNFANGVEAQEIKSVRLSWHLATNDDTNYNNAPEELFSQAKFVPAVSTKALPTPATLAVQLLQIGTEEGSYYGMTQKVGINSERTDRATIYLVPTNKEAMAARGEINELDDTALSRGIYNSDGKNVVKAGDFASTNDHAKDYPLITYCNADEGEDFTCSVIMELPEAAGEGSRDSNSFTFVIYMPYEGPETDFALEFFKTANPGSTDSPVMLDNTQVVIDSTGRANDLYSRVEVRLEPEINDFDYPFYAVQANELEKNLIVTDEHSDYSGYYENIDKHS